MRKQLASTRLIDRDAGPPDRWMVFLHGILGRRANWRSMARRLIGQRSGWGALLVDLREHGDSRGLAPPHTVDAAARDVVELLDGEGIQGVHLGGLLGHSFGGKVALAAAGQLGDRHEGAPPGELWVIDSPPGSRAGGGEDGGLTRRVFEVLGGLPDLFASRGEFLDALTGAGIAAGTAQWLAMNLEREGDRFRFALDLSAMNSLIEDFHATDLWGTIEGGIPGCSVHLVVGGQSEALSEAELSRARRVADAGDAELHVLEDAGHWVHIDDPQGLLRVLG
jgi:pimeloyl-ACP methyl ester carboxylesterase